MIMGESENIILNKEIELAEELLKKAKDKKNDALNAKREHKSEKARLRLETDWSTVSDNRMTDKDKEAWVNYQVAPLQETADTLQCEADYYWELWELQKIILRKL